MRTRAEGRPAMPPKALIDQQPPARVESVTGEGYPIPPEPLRAFRPELGPARTRSARPRGGDGALVPGALDHGSVQVRQHGHLLTPNVDYRLHEFWGSLTFPESRRVAEPPEGVELCYRWSSRRVDSVSRDEQGEWHLLQGEDHLSAPCLPILPSGHERVTNIFFDHFASRGQTMPCRPGGEPVSATQLDRMPRVRARRETGRPVRIVCWGDSVTGGGDATSEDTAFPARVRQQLGQAWGEDALQLSVLSAGGSTTRDWLHRARSDTDVAGVLELEPDLVISEFVNDGELDPSEVEVAYTEIGRLLRNRSIDWMITTPHFVHPAWMGPDASATTDRDQRPVTRLLRQLAHQHGAALADVGQRWANLADEGIPYVTLLSNGVNHPDDRGHLLAATEIVAALGVADGRSEGSSCLEGRGRQ